MENSDESEIDYTTELKKRIISNMYIDTLREKYIMDNFIKKNDDGEA